MASRTTIKKKSLRSRTCQDIDLDDKPEAVMFNDDSQMSDKYKIVVMGNLPERWSIWFDSTKIVYDSEQKQTAIYTDVVDQTTLHGLLNGIRDLGLYLVSVQIVG